MGYYTETELLSSNQYIAYKLGVLYHNDPQSFLYVIDYLPFFVCTNCRISKNFLEGNQLVKNLFDANEFELFKSNSVSFVAKIANPEVFKFAIEQNHNFELINDTSTICTTFQNIKFRSECNWYISNKKIINHGESLNVAYALKDLGTFGVKVSKILDIVLLDSLSWRKLMSLTKKEKEIIKLIAEGYSNDSIADILFSSPHTIRTHRENIRFKIDAHNISDITRFVQAFDLIGAM